jgi:hypothetical protein
VTSPKKSCWTLSAVALLAACGSTARIDPPRPQTAHLDWTESGDPHNLLGGPIVFHVRTLRLGPKGWTVDAAVVNRTKQPLRILYAHEAPGHNEFGLYVLKTDGYALATRFHPRVPTLLLPGERWSGTFSGPAPVARGTHVSVQFGQFATTHGDRFAFVTDHAYVVR